MPCSFLLDRDALLADVDVDAAPLLALVIELIAEHDDGDCEGAEDQEENSVAGHGIRLRFSHLQPEAAKRAPPLNTRSLQAQIATLAADLSLGLRRVDCFERLMRF